MLENASPLPIKAAGGVKTFDQAMEMTAKFMTPAMLLIFGIVFGIIILVLCALVVSLFTKKNNPALEG